MSVVVRRIDPEDDAGMGAYVDIVNAVTPELPTSTDDLRWSATTYPGGRWYLAYLDGRPAGAGTVGRIYMYDAAFERFWFGIRVLPDARRRGLGGALWSATSAAARDAGKTGLQTDVLESQTDGVAFLGRRRFEIVERMKAVRLDLRDVRLERAAPPPGIVITSLAERPDLEPGLHEVAVEAYPDIPSVDERVAVGSLEEFLARDVRRVGIPPGALAIALDEASGRVVGWASLLLAPGSSTVAYHDMTAVRPAWRGRGIATTLKRATIAWAIEHGLDALETGNDESNAAMRAVNARLGYRPTPDLLTMRGPLAPVRTG